MHPTLAIAMMAMMLFTAAAPGHAAPPHRCAGDALKCAPALLKLHLPDAGHPFGFDKKVEQITSVANPAAPRQSFDVLQVWGFVYKAKYRLRFLYAQLAGSCVLMGQEVMEHAKL